jgi:hypothetical protein
MPPQPQPPVEPQPPAQSEVATEATATLPDSMPEKWLAQIKSALSPSWWAAIAGSSVLAAAISSGVSLYVAAKSNEANRQLEQLKSGLELQKESARARIAAYTRLAEALSDLATKLEGFENFLEIAQRSSISSGTNERIQEQLQAIGISERAVVTARNDPILSKSETAGAVNDSLSKLTPILMSKEHAAGSLSDIRSSITTIRELIARIQDHNLKEIDGIH